MGHWSVPWRRVEIANEFARRMRAPWLVDVARDEDGGIDIELEDIGAVFWDQECLVGNDELVDLLADAIEDSDDRLDIRPLVAQSLSRELEAMELQPRLPADLDAINVVRMAVGKPPLSPARPLAPHHTQALALEARIQRQGIALGGIHLQRIAGSIQGFGRTLLGVPDGYDDRDVFVLYCHLREDETPPVSLDGVEYVIRDVYERPGLLKIWFV